MTTPSEYGNGYIPYEPDEDEIRRKCAEIRSGWTDTEERKRCAWACSPPLEVQRSTRPSGPSANSQSTRRDT